MNIITSHKTLVRLWAAIYCDFESVLSKFMGSKGWRYAHFAKVCRDTRITLIMHITQARGKSKDEHYERITDIVLQLAKHLWLRTGYVPKDRTVTAVDKTMELKRSLGGFYLAYTMYERQPIQGHVKIGLGLDDMLALNRFFEAVQDVPFRSEINFMFNYLMCKGAFSYCIYSTQFRFDITSRNFLNSSRSETVQLTRRVRDVQDVLAFSSVHNGLEAGLQELYVAQNDIAKDMLKTVDPEKLIEHLKNETAFGLFARTVTSENLKPALDKFDKLVDKPIMTLQSLTATEAIERRMMMETKKRMEVSSDSSGDEDVIAAWVKRVNVKRARKKALLTNVRDREGEPKLARPYVREGGIFGRKKDIDEDDKCKRRERGACSGNLWVYINGYDFDRPMGARDTKDCPVNPLDVDDDDEHDVDT